jgi:hypothetical protein
MACRHAVFVVWAWSVTVVGRWLCIVIFEGAKGFYVRGWCVGCNTSESIIVTRRPPTTETHVSLRTILSAGVLAVLLLACAGAAGATWVVDDDGGADRIGMRTVEAAG